MRKLAIFSVAFSCAVFAACYVIESELLAPLGMILAVLLVLVLLLHKRWRGDRGLALALILAGLSLGIFWLFVYRAVFLAPAEELDDCTVKLSAVVTQWPQKRYNGCTVSVRVQTLSRIGINAVLYTDEQGEELRPGDRISTVAYCMTGNRSFLGEEISYQTAKGIFLQCLAYGHLEVEHPEQISPRYWPAFLSGKIKMAIKQCFPDDVTPFICALVTGDRHDLSDEFSGSLRRTGLSHAVAVSGMHLAVLASLLTILFGTGKRSTAVGTILFAVCFCGVVGNTPSVLRAAIMIVLLQLAPLFNREQDNVTALAFALMVLLILNPMSAAHIGLQMSFAAVVGIFLTTEQIRDCLLSALKLNQSSSNKVIRVFALVGRFVVDTLATTLGASLLTIPLSAIHFRTFSLIAPISNILTLWAISLLLIGGLLAGLVGILSTAAGAVLVIPFIPLARYLIWAIDQLAKPALAALPLDIVYYRVWLVFVYLLLGLTAILPGKKRKLIPICAGVVTLAVSIQAAKLDFYRDTMLVSVLDVGQGQSVLLRMGSKLVLVDCGGFGTYNAGDVAADYIQARGGRKIDLLILSHFHTDHTNGIPRLLERMDIDTIFVSDVEKDNLMRDQIIYKAKALDTKIVFVEDQTTLELDRQQSITVYPPMRDFGDSNDLGLSVLATAGENDVMLTGDMSAEGELQLIQYQQLPHTELLIAGHHGSESSSHWEFLNTICPEVVVISAGRNNRYGHPAEGALERFQDVGAEVYRTDLQGTITVRFNSEKEEP